LSETDKFLKKHIESHKRDLGVIVTWMRNIGNFYGAKENYFRPEKIAHALPPTFVGNKLRLYCLRHSDTIVILGNGGEKSTRTYQEDPVLNDSVEVLEKVYKQLQYALRVGDVFEDYDKLLGVEDLTFSINR
jgi:hypothetical protein